jgi:lipopolysaccharide/colanic/teichoic acid biosynthesis glycosyltransferase
MLTVTGTVERSIALPVRRLPLFERVPPAPAVPDVPAVKRIFDVVVASVLLLAVVPVLLAAAVAIKLTSAGPVLYRQRRVGYRGRPFEVWKLRTMAVDADREQVGLHDRNCADGLLFKVRDDPRVLPVGRILRRLSIDELPQLVNVLRGEMSLVGPRPLPVAPEQFGPWDGLRHRVLPGITGAWQVCRADRLSYRTMVELDLGYIRTWSLSLDVALLFKTARAVFSPGGNW